MQTNAPSFRSLRGRIEIRTQYVTRDATDALDREDTANRNALPLKDSRGSDTEFSRQFARASHAVDRQR
ncbi:hypothetical protein JOH52_000662 [Sinorhizobium meliloti]|nr:hypothetical protein [Sinorhizobium meliloti]GEC36631.1 hypothetical protein EME01_07030 [Sinorhizobium meliloti]